MTIFAVAIAVATFVENKHTTQFAKDVIYNAVWMQILLILIGINLVASVIVDKLYMKGKQTNMIFHLAFVFMLIGAGLTYYVGYEGTMHIREGSSSNEIFMSDVQLTIIPDVDKPDNIIEEKLEKNLYPISVKDAAGEEIEINFKNYIPNAESQIFENSPDGVDIIELTVATETGNLFELISDGEIKQIGQLTFAFNSDDDPNAVQFNLLNDSLMISAPAMVYRMQMGGTVEDSIAAGERGLFIPNKVYAVEDQIFFFRAFFNKGKEVLVAGSGETRSPDALVADISYKGQSKEVNIFGGDGYQPVPEEFQIGNKSIQIAYGNKSIKLPFSLYLKDFIMERYPGSNNPSSYESKVILKDERENLEMDYDIYMNNVLDYGGYRFFQSSFDPDEKGTILSVNYDMPGTLTTYFSYILLIIGFIATLFNKKSRFRALSRRIGETGRSRKSAAMILIVLLGFSFSASAQTGLQKPVSEKHAEDFGKLIVQTYEGRFQPIHTLANNVVMKIYKKTTYTDEIRGNMNAVQIFMDFILNSEYWKDKPIIYVKNDDIKYIIGVSGKYAKFNDFFDPTGNYKLAQQSENAFQKSKSEKTDFDNEVMKVNERLNILLMSFRGGLLKIFPEQNSPNNNWVSLEDSSAYRPLTGSINAINEDLQLETLTYSNILMLYLQNVSQAVLTNDYQRSDQILGYMSNIQRQIGNQDALPSESKINLEIHYNKANIFGMLKFIYMLLSVVLLALAFADHLRTKLNKVLKLMLNFFIVLLALAFLYHTYGLVLRWYLSGHAPWSNGYEALIFVAWGGLLAGFVFMRYSKITLAATALLAFLITMVAGLSSYDPQITTLQPVLKSYWLIIHVAVIVTSYGFLGLGFILGMINLFSYASLNTNNVKKLSLSIKDLSNINEMTLVIGIILATIGTFLGAVWANESWGRYWGWDAKETWALIIILVYAVVLHLRLIPSLNNLFIFNTASVIGFGTVIMTFFGVNYYFTKGLHSYASGDAAIFPTWAWIAIGSLILLIVFANLRSKKFKVNDTDRVLKEE